jgi:hypothetical protein
MSKHRNPRPKVPKRLSPDNLATSILIRRLYDALVELEALAVTADEAVTMLPAGPTGRYKRTLARLYSLVGRTAGQANATLGLKSWSPCTRRSSPESARALSHCRVCSSGLARQNVKILPRMAAWLPTSGARRSETARKAPSSGRARSGFGP